MRLVRLSICAESFGHSRAFVAPAGFGDGGIDRRSAFKGRHSPKLTPRFICLYFVLFLFFVLDFSRLVLGCYALLFRTHDIPLGLTMGGLFI